LEQAALKIRQNSKITLVQLDGKKIKGRLVAVDPGQSLLTMVPQSGKTETGVDGGRLAFRFGGWRCC